MREAGEVGEAGEGGAVLVLHGGPGPGGVAPLVDHLARDHRVLAPTHPGWDGTVRPDSLDSVRALAAAYLDLLARLEVRDATVIGTSFGGWVAAQAAVDDREGRISRLVLVDAVGPVVPGQQVTVPGGPPAPGSEAPAGGPERDGPESGGSESGGSERGGPERGGPERGGPESGGPETGGPEGGGPPVGAMGGAMAAMWVYAGPDMGDPDLLPRLSAVTCPVLVVWGGDDTVVTPEFGRAYAAGFPHARFELIPGVGHAPVREAPEALSALLDPFLAHSDSDSGSGAL
ncbi:hydrolase [Streptomyces varsoviensis]|uniref:Hydrolase n=1 Tax=Streptomyces varsoviensis TaxID=67373 RepID=A0ABR5JDZ0_9ACTN|nr:hydrolase [Streptomyces varsoviensis]